MAKIKPTIPGNYCNQGIRCIKQGKWFVGAVWKIIIQKERQHGSYTEFVRWWTRL